MKYLSSLFNLAFVLVFSVHSSAWAFTNPDTISTKILVQLVEKYNGLSNQQKHELLSASLSERPAADQEFLKNSGNLSQLKFPELKLDGDKFVIKHEAKDFRFGLLADGSLTYEGTRIDFSPGHLKEGFEQLEKLSGMKSFSLIELIMPNAYADAGLAVILLIIGGIGFILGRLLVSAAALECENKLWKSMQALDSDAPVEELKELESLMKKQLAQVKTEHPGCAVKSRNEKCAPVRKLVQCLEVGLKELHSKYKVNVNNSERGTSKDLPAPARPASSKGARAISQ